MPFPIPWRWVAIIVALASILAAGWYVWTLQRSNAKLKADLAAATEQAASNGEALKSLDRYTTKTTIIREKADAAIITVQAAPGAADPVPAGVLDAWRAAINGMRDDAKPDDSGS